MLNFFFLKFKDHALVCNPKLFDICRYYINYKLMKKKVRQYAQQIEVGAQDRQHVLKDFSRMLDNQVREVLQQIVLDAFVLGNS